VKSESPFEADKLHDTAYLLVVAASTACFRDAVRNETLQQNSVYLSTLGRLTEGTNIRNTIDGRGPPLIMQIAGFELVRGHRFGVNRSFTPCAQSGIYTFRLIVGSRVTDLLIMFLTCVL
jgi:hypothetical protein